uniref:Uncharacterized protein n=1 Tax=Anguilla anguilla TaxID=7936 RepID=A0A0E9S9Z5_ANGAN
MTMTNQVLHLIQRAPSHLRRTWSKFEKRMRCQSLRAFSHATSCSHSSLQFEFPIEDFIFQFCWLFM